MEKSGGKLKSVHFDDSIIDPSTETPSYRNCQNGARKQHNKLNTAGFSAKLLEACRFVFHCWHKHTFGSENICSQTEQYIYTDADTHSLCECVCVWRALCKLYHLMPFSSHRAACFPITLPCWINAFLLRVTLSSQALFNLHSPTVASDKSVLCSDLRLKGWLLIFFFFFFK